MECVRTIAPQRTYKWPWSKVFTLQREFFQYCQHHCRLQAVNILFPNKIPPICIVIDNYLIQRHVYWLDRVYTRILFWLTLITCCTVLQKLSTGNVATGGALLCLGIFPLCVIYCGQAWWWLVCKGCSQERMTRSFLWCNGSHTFRECLVVNCWH